MESQKGGKWHSGYHYCPTVPGTCVRFPAWVTVCVESARSPRACVGFPRVIQLPPTLRKTPKMCVIDWLAMLNWQSVSRYGEVGGISRVNKWCDVDRARVGLLSVQTWWAEWLPLADSPSEVCELKTVGVQCAVSVSLLGRDMILQFQCRGLACIGRHDTISLNCTHGSYIHRSSQWWGGGGEGGSTPPTLCSLKPQATYHLCRAALFKLSGFPTPFLPRGQAIIIPTLSSWRPLPPCAMAKFSPHTIEFPCFTQELSCPLSLNIDHNTIDHMISFFRGFKKSNCKSALVILFPHLDFWESARHSNVGSAHWHWKIQKYLNVYVPLLISKIYVSLLPVWITETQLPAAVLSISAY